tara:strand:- start:15 stop:539 length:525 start_codon:yes stop_codon:yes gene_type:complete
VIKLKEIYKKIIEDIEPPKYTLYCDMDGVLADFETRFEQYSDGLTTDEYRDEFGISAFWELVNGEGVGFWVGIPWMSDGKELFDYIKPNLFSLLSAPSSENSSRLGKRLWVKNKIPGTKLILASAKNKQNYSEEGAILIDDREDTIREWDSRGGIGILHTSAASTIQQLQKLGL